MKLTYRGVNYEPQTTPAAIPAADLSYRGVRYRQKQATAVKNLNAVLTYRGVTYTTQPAAQPVAQPAVAASVAAPSLTVDQQARQLGINHHRLVKNRQQSMLSRSAAEIGLAAGVTNYWNRIQGKIHPSFWATYDRSHATLS